MVKYYVSLIYSCANSQIERLLKKGCGKYARKTSANHGKELQKILDIIKASQNLEEFRTITSLRRKRFHFHPLVNKDGKDYEGCWAIAIVNKVTSDRVIIRPVVGDNEEKIEFEKVVEIIIVAIENDYH